MEKLEAKYSPNDGCDAEDSRRGCWLFEEHHAQDCGSYRPNPCPNCIGGAERKRLHCKPE